MRILLVDDHGPVRAALRQSLELEPGLEVVGEAGDGVAALALLERLTVDVALVDVRMPGMTGHEVARRIRERWPNIRVVACSSSADLPSVAGMVEAGAAGYVLKGDAPGGLIASLHAAAAPQVSAVPRG